MSRENFFLRLKLSYCKTYRKKNKIITPKQHNDENENNDAYPQQ